MKKIVLVVATLLIPLILFGQNSSLLKDAQDLFAAGNYTAAVTKFQEAVNKLSGRERNIAQLQLATARTCVEALSNAKTAESAKDYDKAIAEYQTILDANPNDSRVKNLQDAAKIAKREANPTLSVSRSSLSFSSSGGTEKITVSSSMTWTVSGQFSNMCTITRAGNEITIVCSPNTSSTPRNCELLIKTNNGIKQQRVSISQTGKSYSSNTNPSHNNSTSNATLTLPTTDITVPSIAGTRNIYVTTNADSFQIELLPKWCKVTNRYKTYFVLAYEANPSSYSRSDWFRVRVGAKTVRIDITQRGTDDTSYGISRTDTRTTRSGFPFQLSIPAIIEYFPIPSSNLIRVGGGLGIGGYGSPFHVDLLAMYMNKRTSFFSSGCAYFSVEPVWNMKRYKSNYPFSDFHVNIGPTIGYSRMTGLTYGARLGIGIHYSDLSAVAQYSQSLGWMFGVSFKIHVAHITLKE